MEENRKKALAAALGQIEKQFGKGSVMRLGDAAASYEVETVSTGSLGLDIALVSVACRAAAWWRSSGPRPPARPRSPAGHRRSAARWRHGRVRRRGARARPSYAEKPA